MLRLLKLSLIIIGVLGKPSNEKCKLTDKPCMLKLVNTLYTSLFSVSGDLDPMNVDVIEGIFPTLKYNATDTHIKGLKNCQIVELSFDLDKHVLDKTFMCPHLEWDGKYEMTGTLNGASMEGTGTYSQIASNYGFRFHATTDLQTRDGKKFISFKDVKVVVDPQEMVVTEINSNGDKKKAVEILKVFDENWKENIKALHGPLMTAYVNEIAKVANEFYQHNTLEDYVIM
ncbi:uncharacterized protein LOC119189816 [Manduca sexta]|uniref:uncharacterized protein LOC119189816 n=1 Tax=Manduca sexta TaxID=7130 RepID=UPI00188E91BA|nr:uncharacterized protein LOC119189816 [Manduca sexta]